MREYTDRKLTAMMVDDFIHDPILAAKVILNITLPPHSELRIMFMWTTPFTIDDSGFSTAKSHNAAVVMVLRSILFPGRVSGVLSKTFAQGKLIFQNLDRWVSNAPIFKSCLKHAKGNPRLIHGTDVWQAFFRGGSEIRVLPPSFMLDAERLRGERWHDGYFDEWTTYGNFQAFNTTIMGRITKENAHPDCPVRMNHAHMMSTPNFTHHPSFAIVKRYQHQIAQGNKDYGRFSSNYRAIPESFSYLVNKRMIFNLQMSLPSGIEGAEVDGLWQEDSGAYYSYVHITNCRSSINPVVTKRASPSDIYIAGYDVASGGGSSHASADSDDFAISVMRISGETGKPIHTLTLRYNRISAKGMSGIIHKLNLLFNFSLVCYDPGGGGLFVRDELRYEEQLVDNTAIRVTPIIEMFDTTGAIGNRILIPVRRSEHYISMLWGKMSSDSVLANRLHNEMKKNLESHNIILSPPWDGWPGDDSQWDIDSKREWLNRNTALPELDRYRAEMDLAVHQLIQVDVKRDSNKKPMLDTHGMYQFKSKGKKDSAYSLIYANLGCSIWKKITDSGIDINSEGSNLTITSGYI